MPSETPNGAGTDPQADSAPHPGGSKLWWWLGGIATGLVVLLAAGIVAGSAYFGRRAAIVEGLRRTNDKLKGQKKDYRAVEKRADLVAKWIDSDVDWLGQLQFLSKAVPSSEHMYVTSLRFGSGKIYFSGRVKDQDVATRFTEKLMAVPGYQGRTRGLAPGKDKCG